MHIYLCQRNKEITSEDLVRKFLLSYVRDLDLSLSLGILDGAPIQRTPKGKPYFADPELEGIHFSVSHSGRYWGCAFESFPIGFDLEDQSRGKLLEGKDRRPPRYEAIAKRFFAPEEYELVRANGREAFYSLWVRKEAYLKYTGEGLASGLSRCSGGMEEGIYCDEIPLLPGLTAAYCSGEKISIEKIRLWDPERGEDSEPHYR